jgi:hypothetical protein
MKKKGGLNVKINFSNRWLYTLIALGILVIISVGVYALQAGVKPNPGHDLSELGVPSGCTSGQFIYWDGNNLACMSQSQSLCPVGTTVYYNYSNLNEDTYGAQSSGQSSVGTDTCDGIWTPTGSGFIYKCPADGSGSCRDYVYGGGFYYYRDVVCKKNLMLGCRE